MVIRTAMQCNKATKKKNDQYFKLELNTLVFAS